MSAPAMPVSISTADLVSLTKPRLSSLVLATTAGGLWLAPGHISPVGVLVTLLATAGIVAAANTFNCYLERDSDRFMARTRARPLPSGRMEPQVALWFGVSLGLVCVPALVLAANLLTGLLGLLALFTYVLVYTPLKAKSSTAMVVGAIPGALPPLMGWTAVTGSLDTEGAVLFAILFLWQMPHFIAISLFRKEEYAAAGIKSVALVFGEQASRALIVAYLLMLVPVSVLPYVLRMAGVGYAVPALLLGAIFLGFGAWGFLKRLGRGWARQLFLVSLLYLPGLFVALALDRAGHG